MEMELARAKADAEMQLAREKAQMEAQLARERNAMQAANNAQMSKDRPGGSLAQ
jgi:F0F1-type ATP synthase membrane subunit b/b'